MKRDSISQLSTCKRTSREVDSNSFRLGGGLTYVTALLDKTGSQLHTNINVRKGITLQFFPHSTLAVADFLLDYYNLGFIDELFSV